MAGTPTRSPGAGSAVKAGGTAAPGAARAAAADLAVLQRVVGNRNMRRALARTPGAKIVGGVETKLVRPAVIKFLDDNKIKYWREVKFELLNDKGGVEATGYFDFVLRDPRTNQLVFRELKGDDLESLTDQQQVYVKKFLAQGGGKVHITSAKGNGNISVSVDKTESVSASNFKVVGKEHLGAFGAEIGEMATGKKVTNVYIGPEGMKVFHNQADADAFYKSKNIPTSKPPAKPAADDKPTTRPKPDRNQKHPMHDPPKAGDKPPAKSGSTDPSVPSDRDHVPKNANDRGPKHFPKPQDAKVRVTQPAKPATPPAKPAKPPTVRANTKPPVAKGTPKSPTPAAKQPGKSGTAPKSTVPSGAPPTGKPPVSVDVAQRTLTNALDQAKAKLMQAVSKDPEMAAAIKDVNDAMQPADFIQNPKKFSAQYISNLLVSGAFGKFASKLAAIQADFEAKYPPAGSFVRQPYAAGQQSAEQLRVAYEQSIRALRTPDAAKTLAAAFLFVGLKENASQKEIDLRTDLLNKYLASRPGFGEYVKRFNAAKRNYQDALFFTIFRLKTRSDELSELPAGFFDQIRRRGEALQKAADVANKYADQLWPLAGYPGVDVAVWTLTSVADGFDSLGAGLQAFAESAGRRQAEYEKEQERLAKISDDLRHQRGAFDAMRP